MPEQQLRIVLTRFIISDVWAPVLFFRLHIPIGGPPPGLGLVLNLHDANATGRCLLHHLRACLCVCASCFTSDGRFATLISENVSVSIVRPCVHLSSLRNFHYASRVERIAAAAT